MSRIFHILCQLHTNQASLAPKVALLRPTLLALSRKTRMLYLRSNTHICGHLYSANDSFVAITTHVLEKNEAKGLR